MDKQPTSLLFDFNFLPEELLILVFEYLFPKDLLVCSVVSKTWLRLADDDNLWKRVCERSWSWEQNFSIYQEKQMKGGSWKQFYKYFAVNYLKKVKWFVNISRQLAETYLANKPVGTYLIRNSSITGHYVVSYVDDSGRVSHKLIVNLGAYKGVFLESEHVLYPNLSAFLKAKRHTFKKIASTTVPINVKRDEKMALCVKYLSNETVRNGKTLSELGVLHYAIKYRSIILIQRLLIVECKELKVDVNGKFKKGKTPLHYLAKYHDSEDMTVANMLLNLKANVNVKDDFGNTPLHYAVSRKDPNLPLIKFLLEHGAIADGSEGAGESGYTVLGLATAKGHIGVVMLLLDSFHVNPNIPQQQHFNQTPLHIAARKGHLELVSFFVGYCNMNINAVDANGSTPLHQAVSNDQDWTNLAKIGAPLNQPHYCSSIVLYLIQSGASVNIQDKDGKTPLHLACEKGHRTSARHLLMAGADLFVKDNRGWEPMRYCKEHIHSPGSAVSWHKMVLREKISMEYDGLTEEQLQRTVDNHYEEILKLPSKLNNK